MEESPKDESTAPAGAQNPSHLFRGLDSISSLPDEILHHIFSFVPTNVAITTTVLSKRWRHVWCKIPYLSFPHINNSSIESIHETLASYTAPKIMRFHLYVDSQTWEDSERSSHVDRLIKFAIAHNVEKLSLVLNAYYVFPDFFFSNSSLKQLIVDSRNISPKCNVSWTSLQTLSLRNSSLDEYFTKLLSGSPMLESLILQSCSLPCLDLSESPRVRRLDIGFFSSSPRKCHIVAPHIHYLRLVDFTQKCTLVDVSSLTEADIETIYFLPRFWCTQDDPSTDPSKDEYQVMMQTMLEKLQNVENLTVGLSFLQMLSIAEFSGVHFPTFKVKTLTLKTTILRSAVVGIAKLLQNSPELKKIVFYKSEDWNCAVEKYVNLYIDPQDPQDLIFPAKSAFNVAKPDLVASFIELLLRNTRTLETLVLQLRSCLNTSNYDELSQVALTLSHKNKVSIVLK
ncbi:F-box domain-containing protein [Hirschfeldia incana]|nr:F-box domain-containing protein [Hirschfeldia incana]